MVVEGLVSDSVSTADVLPAKLLSPPYTAVIECAPAASELVENDARPEAFSVTVASAVAPSSKVTLPVGVPVAPFVATTVAVKVTDCPAGAGFCDEVTVVAELNC